MGIEHLLSLWINSSERSFQVQLVSLLSLEFSSLVSANTGKSFYLDASHFLVYCKATAQWPKAISPATAQSTKGARASPSLTLVFQAPDSRANQLFINGLGTAEFLSFSHWLTMSKLLSKVAKHPAEGHTAPDEDPRILRLPFHSLSSGLILRSPWAAARWRFPAALLAAFTRTFPTSWSFLKYVLFYLHLNFDFLAFNCLS